LGNKRYIGPSDNFFLSLRHPLGEEENIGSILKGGDGKSTQENGERVGVRGRNCREVRWQGKKAQATKVVGKRCGWGGRMGEG